MLRLDTNSKNLRKNVKNANVNTKEDKYSDGNIFGRYAYNQTNNGRNSHVQRRCNLPPQTFGFCFETGDIHFELLKRKEVIWATINSLKMCLSLTQEMLKIQSECQNIHAKGQVTVHKLTQLLGLVTLTVQTVLPAQMNFRYLQQQKVKALRATQCYQATVFLNNNLKEEFQWWIQNLQIFKGRYLTRSQIFLTIRTEISKKGWGVVCQGKH